MFCKPGHDQENRNHDRTFSGFSPLTPHAVRRDIECPRKNQSRDETDDENQEDEFRGPFGQLENIGEQIGDLQQNPGRNDVGRANTQYLTTL